MTSQPWYLLFAGVNGAGKSTLYHSGLWQHADMPSELKRVNADEILLEQGGDWKDTTCQVRAGREAIERTRTYLRECRSFSHECTLAGKTVLHTLQQAHDLGFFVRMHYVGVQDPGLANERIAHRLEAGGHGIDAQVVIRRWERSQEHFLRAVKFCNEVLLFDNTRQMRLVARLKRGAVTSVYPADPSVTWHRQLLSRLQRAM